MKKKRVIIILCCLFIIICGWNFYAKNKYRDQMPEIVFRYTSSYSMVDYDNEEYEYLFTSDGKVYYNDDKEIYYLSHEEKVKRHQKNELTSDMILINSVDVEELQEKYNLLWDMLAEGKCNLEPNVNYSLDVVEKECCWSGLHYNRRGNIDELLFYMRDEITYTNTDPRARELAEWMNEVIRLDNSILDSI